MMLVRHDPTSGARVRREIAADLRARSVSADSVDDVVLVASELVGNAIRHAQGDDGLDVAWEVQDDCVVVRVNDSSQELPQLRQPDVTSAGGRGLAIVASLAAEWGVLNAARGKQVWAKVLVHHAL